MLYRVVAVNIIEYFNSYLPYIKKGFVVDIPPLWKAVIAIFALVTVVIACILRKYKKLDTSGALAFSVLAVYLFVFTLSAIILRQPEPSARLSLDLFWAYRKWLIDKQNFFPEIAGNILIMIPVGILLPACFKKGESTKKRFLFTVGIGFAISFLIELVQFLFKKGLADANDLLNNLLGIFIGFLIYIIAIKLIKWMRK